MGFQVRDGGVQLLQQLLYEGHALPRLGRHKLPLALFVGQARTISKTGMIRHRVHETRELQDKLRRILGVVPTGLTPSIMHVYEIIKLGLALLVNFDDFLGCGQTKSATRASSL